VFAPYDHAQNNSWYFKLSERLLNGQFGFHTKDKFDNTTLTQKEYLSICQNLINKIQNSELNKVVLSRTQFYEVEPKDLFDWFVKIKELYVDAFTYIIVHPDVGVWMGATPELLIEGQKEIDEHAFITKYVTEELHRADIAHTIGETYTSAAGQVCHIKSDITIEGNPSIDILTKALHPGPAISGYPKDLAMQTIKSIESHDRKYYCGYLGPLNDDNCNLFINLRCMQVYSNGIEIFVGGGITKDSSPQAEWQETELKAQTMMALFSKMNVL